MSKNPPNEADWRTFQRAPEPTPEEREAKELAAFFEIHLFDLERLELLFRAFRRYENS